MAEQVKIGSYDFKEVEESVIKYWEKNDIYKETRKLNKGKKKFFFIQGPPYTSGKLHMGHAWNNTLKDMALRYKSMTGHEVFDRAAYDMHGLPIARKVMAENNLRTKDDIPKFGMEKFIQGCIDFSSEKARMMNEDLWRLAVWLDYENACLPINNSYIEGIWFLIKKTYENDRLYEGLRTLPWCANCQSGMAKHECEYHEVKEKSIFVKFPVKGKKNEFLIIWTTTPWTLAFNLAVMVHPELDYVKAKVDDEIWILAKGLAAPVVQTVVNKKLNIIEEMKGADLEGLEYTHPWDKRIDHYKEIKTKHPKTHTVLLSEEFVNLSAGTGLVHCAPGCGPEDFEVGRANNIPPFNTLKEDGVYSDDMGPFKGIKAKKDDHKFIEYLEKDNMLIATTEVEHDYAHCERCHDPVIFRATKQWFFKVEDLKERMLEGNEKIHWVPGAGKDAFNSWLVHLRDNSITKQRFWGTPVPIWKCTTCSKVEVIGSAEELNEKAGHVPKNLHKPWIDEVEINCECGSMMKRIPDVLDVWIDAGTLSWNILDYPKNKELMRELWPADFILEAKEQVRLWFNMLMVTSILAFDDPYPFKAVYMHGMLTDVEGVKMSKSLGNVISPYEIIDKHGADTLRYYMMQTTAGEDISFSWEEIALRHRNLSVLWNLHKYFIDFTRNNSLSPKDFTEETDEIKDNLGEVERFILSRTQSILKDVTENFEKYQLDVIPRTLDQAFLELSRTYIQMTRDKASSGTPEEKKAVAYTIYRCLLDTTKTFSTVCPFISEKIYLALKNEYGLEEGSVHQTSWPSVDESLIDPDLEESMKLAQVFIQSILAGREKLHLGVRWPIKEVTVMTSDDKVKKALRLLANLVKVQTNIKKLSLTEEMDGVESSLKPDFAKLGPIYGDKTAKLIANLATVSMNAIMTQIEQDGKYVCKVDGDEFEVLKDHFTVLKTCPPHLQFSECRYGEVYLDNTRTPELDAEGYAREIVRRVQMQRKNAGLSKNDMIELHIQLDDELLAMVLDWKDNIKEKVGALKIEMAASPANKMEFSAKEKVKGKGFTISLNKGNL